jgi:hypothetical protein
MRKRNKIRSFEVYIDVGAVPPRPLEPNYGFAKSIFSRGAVRSTASPAPSYRFCCTVAAIGCNGAYPQTSVWGSLAAHCRTRLKEEICKGTRGLSPAVYMNQTKVKVSI